MAPSIAETVSHTVDHIQAKAASIISKDTKSSEVKPEDTSALEVKAPEVLAPEAKDFETQLLENQNPLKVPESLVPEVKEQEVHAPETKAPQVQAPLKTDSQHKEPLKLSGALNGYNSFDVTPVIGKEFIDVNLAEWLKAPNSDELIRDLAITSTFSRSNFLISY